MYVCVGSMCGDVMCCVVFFCVLCVMVYVMFDVCVLGDWNVNIVCVVMMVYVCCDVFDVMELFFDGFLW